MSPQSPQLRMSRSLRQKACERNGSITVLMAVLAIFVLALVAFGVDVGYIMTVNTELKRTADAAALAGASVLVEGQSAANAEVHTFVSMNQVGGHAVPGSDITVETGQWDINARQFTPGGDTPSAIRVLLQNKDQPLFFARALGHMDFDTHAEAIAVYQPRDIMIVLDFSASMNDDSTFAAIGTLGQPSIEANLLDIYNDMGAPQFGNMTFTPVSITSTNNTVIKNTLGLNGVAWPFPQGSWDEYINYVKASGNANAAAGYRKKYGYLTWTHFLLVNRPKYSETPVLWQTSCQPVGAVKDAVQEFLAYLQLHETDDRVGLTVYTSTNGTATLETTLTNNFTLVGDTTQHRQAGHYDQYTNIGDGINVGRLDLVNNARTGAAKLMILMTDGIANRPTGTDPKAYALAKAQLVADAGIKIVTISFGASADTNLMQQIADLSGGIHFNIPGGQSVADYEEDLEAVFAQVAADRPLRLVK